MGDPQPSITLANLPWPVVKRILPMVPIQQLDELRLISPHWNTIILEYRKCPDNYPYWKGSDRQVDWLIATPNSVRRSEGYSSRTVSPGVMPFHWDLRILREPGTPRENASIRTYSGFTPRDSLEKARSYRTELIEDSSPTKKNVVLWTTCIGPQLKLWDRLIATVCRQNASSIFRNRRHIDTLNVLCSGLCYDNDVMKGMIEAMWGVRITTLNFFGCALDAKARSTIIAMLTVHYTLAVNIVTDFDNIKDARSVIASLMQLGLKKLEICDGWSTRNPLYPDHYRKFWE